MWNSLKRIPQEKVGCTIKITKDFSIIIVVFIILFYNDNKVYVKYNICTDISRSSNIFLQDKIRQRPNTRDIEKRSMNLAHDINQKLFVK